MIESEPDTVVRNVFDSQQSGATAVVTDDAHVPMIAATLSTSMSLRAARTAASGFVWSSSLKSWIRRPAMPPAPLICSATHSIALRIDVVRPLRPSTRMYARAASASASRPFCSTITIATPSALIARIVSNRISAARGARPADGSSSSSTVGATISAIAIARI